MLPIVCALVIVCGCGDDGPAEAVRPVKTLVLEARPHEITQVFSGRTEASQAAVLSFRVPGQIHRFQDKRGTLFEEGELIAQLDLRDFEITERQIEGAIDQARAELRILRIGARAEDIAALESELAAARTALEEADRQLRRHRALLDEELISKSAYERVRTEQAAAEGTVESLRQQLRKARIGGREEEIEAAEARLRSLEAQRDEARAALDDASLKSPFRGRLTETFVDNYQTIEAAVPIAVLQNIETLEVTVGIPEQLSVRLDQIIDIQCRLEAFADEAFDARIVETGPDADRMTRTYPLTVQIDIPPEIKALPGMTADIEITRKRPPKNDQQLLFAVPPEAVVRENDTAPYVWLVDESDWTVHRRDVTIVHVTHRAIYIAGPLEPGQRIVAAGAAFLQEGRQVRALTETNKLK